MFHGSLPRHIVGAEPCTVYCELTVWVRKVGLMCCIILRWCTTRYFDILSSMALRSTRREEKDQNCLKNKPRIFGFLVVHVLFTFNTTSLRSRLRELFSCQIFPYSIVYNSCILLLHCWQFCWCYCLHGRYSFNQSNAVGYEKAFVFMWFISKWIWYYI